MTLRSDHETDRTWHEETIKIQDRESRYYKINGLARTVEPDGEASFEARWCEVWFVSEFGADRIASINSLADARLFVAAKMSAA